MKNIYISQLNNKQQRVIKSRLIDVFKNELELKNQEIEEELERAMSSRLGDLSDTINIQEFLD